MNPLSLGVIMLDCALNLYSHGYGKITLIGTVSTIEPVLGKSSNLMALPSADPSISAVSFQPHMWDISRGPSGMVVELNDMGPARVNGCRSNEQQPAISPSPQSRLCSSCIENACDSDWDILPSPSPMWVSI